jgi:hypothetical protein
MRHGSILLLAVLSFVDVALLAQNQPFPAGKDGEIYYCPRIDLLPAALGGPLVVELDGELDEAAWARASWQGWTHPSDQPRGDPANGLTPDQDLDIEWAVVADGAFLYVAWRIVDDAPQNQENFQCDAWRDDSVEFYIDARNNGPDCTSTTNQCYEIDDAQFTVGLENEGKDDPELLVFGGLAGKALCDFSGPHPDLCRGVVKRVEDGDGVYSGWQAEVALALETAGNNDDGDPAWTIDPSHGSIIGWNIHGQDDDDGTERDHKLMWSKREVTESSWRNPAALGKLVFVDLGSEIPEFTGPIEDLSCERLPDGSVRLTWRNPADANPERPIRILVDGQAAASVPGDSTSASLTSAQVPADSRDHVIQAVNSGRQPAECTLLQSPFDSCGGIRRWNILGAYANAGGASPGLDAIRRDYMTDGAVAETDFVWFPGATIATEFGGAAASTAIDGGPAGRNPGGLPAVFARFDKAGRVFFQNPEAFGGPLDNVMAYAQCYVVAEAETEVFFASSSDDSIQVILNGAEIWANSTGRGGSTACAPQDLALEPAILERGYNNLIVKVFDGCCDWDFALRFQDAAGEPITEGLDVQLYPEGACPVPPLSAARSIDTGETIAIQGVEQAKWSAGVSYGVSLRVDGLRPAGAAANCGAAPSAVSIQETLPEGWNASGISHGGRAAGSTITWSLAGAELAPATLTYEVKAPIRLGNVSFVGKVAEQGSALSFAVSGIAQLFNPGDFSDQGFVKSMLLLGPYRFSGLNPAAPGLNNIRRDYLTDGAGKTQMTVIPRAGDTVNTNFAVSASLGLAATANRINPNNVPTWSAWRDQDDTIDFAHYYGADINNVMMHAVFYILVEREMSVDLGISSDDSIQVLIEDEEVHINNIARGVGAPDAVTDLVLAANEPILDPLFPGIYRVLVKVFEGTGQHAFRLRFQDPTTGAPISDGLRICLSPAADECPPPLPPEGVRFIRGDANADASVNIADASFLLNFLFLGGPDPKCAATADANDDGAANIADASFILNYLFLGGRDIPAPNACGEGPAAEVEECGEYPGCG